MELDKELLGDKSIELMSKFISHLNSPDYLLHSFRTILSNPIVTPIDSTERDKQVKSTFHPLLFF